VPPPPIDEEEPAEEFIVPSEAKMTSRGFILPEDHGNSAPIDFIPEQPNTTSFTHWGVSDIKAVFKASAQGQYSKVRDAIEDGFPYNTRYVWKGSGMTLLGKMSSTQQSPFYGKTILDVASTEQLYAFLKAIGAKHSRDFVGEATNF
jgi:hypothetical protein